MVIEGILHGLVGLSEEGGGGVDLLRESFPDFLFSGWNRGWESCWEGFSSSCLGSESSCRLVFFPAFWFVD